MTLVTHTHTDEEKKPGITESLAESQTHGYTRETMGMQHGLASTFPVELETERENVQCAFTKQ